MKQKQLPLIEADAQFFHVFKSMVKSGDAAKMGGPAVLVYIVIKTFTDLATGKSFPTMDTIVEMSGMSERNVRRHLKTLAENGYLEIVGEPGKRSRFILKEKIGITNADTGEVDSIATFDYVPLAVQQAQKEIKNFLLTGDATDAKIVKIERLTVNINIQNIGRDGYIVGEGGALEKAQQIRDPQLREKALKLEAIRNKKDG